MGHFIDHLPVAGSDLRPFLRIKHNAKKRFTGRCLFRKNTSKKLGAANRQDKHEEVRAYGESDLSLTRTVRLSYSADYQCDREHSDDGRAEKSLTRSTQKE